ncbi:hypothetical protein RR42_s1488 [Cupriavidus basilensis]|uniref:Uncharacterized protein n=1 Tax=Cupriavidus basilensis TaxID=68895 RepID=A0A0C4YR70_9BURK|nr:hypothetical protein RR42_s1488 [Cupriavidus basilensis]
MRAGHVSSTGYLAAPYVPTGSGPVVVAGGAAPCGRALIPNAHTHEKKRSAYPSLGP